MRRIAIALLGLLAFAAPAQAHGEQVDVQPAPGSTVAAAPAEISIVYSEELILDGSQIVAAAASGESVALGDLQLKGNTLSAAWPADANAGDYRISYRIAGADGHVVTDEFSFTIAEPTPSEPILIAPAPSSSSETPAVIASPMPVVAPASADGTGVDKGTLYLGLGLTLVAGAGLAIWLVRRNG